MKHIADDMGMYSGMNMGIKKKGGSTSERSEIVFQLLVFMGEDKTLDEEYVLERNTAGEGKKAKAKRISMRMKYWLGRTKKLSTNEIYALMQKAKNGANKQALFNYLLKTYGRKSDNDTRQIQGTDERK